MLAWIACASLTEKPSTFLLAGHPKYFIPVYATLPIFFNCICILSRRSLIV